MHNHKRLRAVLSGRSTGSGFDLSVLLAPLYLWTLWCYFLKLYSTSLFLPEGLAWWYYWTDQVLSFSSLTLLVGSSDL